MDYKRISIHASMNDKSVMSENHSDLSELKSVGISQISDNPRSILIFYTKKNNTTLYCAYYLVRFLKVILRKFVPDDNRNERKGTASAVDENANAQRRKLFEG
jgi:hypothetical protein